MKPNIKLLRRTMKYIEEHPEEWNQRYYHCGTTACFAGHAALLAGGGWVAPEDENPNYMVAVPDDPEGRVWNGTIHAVFRAERVLGIPLYASNDLFRSTNTLDDLRRIVGEIIADAEEAHDGS